MKTDKYKALKQFYVEMYVRGYTHNWLKDTLYWSNKDFFYLLF